MLSAGLSQETKWVLMQLGFMFTPFKRHTLLDGSVCTGRPSMAGRGRDTPTIDSPTNTVPWPCETHGFRGKRVAFPLVVRQ